MNLEHNYARKHSFPAQSAAGNTWDFEKSFHTIIKELDLNQSGQLANTWIQLLMLLPLLAPLHFHCRHVPLFLISIDFPLSQRSSPQCSSFFLYSRRETGFGATVFKSNKLSITKIKPNDRLQPLQVLIQPFAHLEPLSGSPSPVGFIHNWFIYNLSITYSLKNVFFLWWFLHFLNTFFSILPK